MRLRTPILCLALMSLSNVANGQEDDPIILNLALPYSIDVEKTMETSFPTESKRPESQVNYSIDRFATCHGPSKKSRANIKPAKGNLQEPLFFQNRFTPSIFPIDDNTKAMCVEFDAPGDLEYFDDYVYDFENYMYEVVLNCETGCGDPYCFDEKGEVYSIEDIETLITDEHRKAFDTYSDARQKEIVENKKLYEQYTKDYNEWQALREKYLNNASVRYQITAPEDLPKGYVAIYTYDWVAYSWCGEPQETEKRDLTAMYIPHKRLKKGEVLDIWIEDAPIGDTWGFVLGDSPESLQKDLIKIQEQVNIQLQQRIDYSGPDLDVLPKELQNRSGESSKGVHSQESSDCCSC